MADKKTIPNGNPMAMFGEQADLLPKLVKSTTRLQGRIYKNYLNAGLQTLDFMRLRLVEDTKLVERICTCDDASAALDAWMRFWTEAASEYSDFAGKMAASNSKMASDAAEEATAEVTDMGRRLAAAA
jgi:hypothetical protein